MFSTPFYYHKTLRKVVSSFGKIFADLTVMRTDKLGNEVNRIKVPLTYGKRDRYLVRAKDDPTLQRPVDIILPAMSFEIVSMEYDGDRKLITMGRNTKSISGDNSHVLREFNPVPWNVGIDLSIISKTIDDGNQIVEQILPYFTPDYTVTYVAIPELDLRDDLPIVLNAVNMQDNYDDEWVTRRSIIWNLNFTLKANFYGPVKQDPLITNAHQDYLIPSGDMSDPAVLAKTPRSIRYEVMPNPLDADPESDYGYTEQILEFNDGKKYNPILGTDEDI